MPKYRVKRHFVAQPLDKPYRLIPLTQGQNAVVDAGDFDWLSQWNWCAQWSPSVRSFYATRRDRENGPTTFMHNLILGVDRTDHKNHDTLDNRRENLRPCSSKQNAQNKRVQRQVAGGFKGVQQLPSGKWQSVIWARNENRYLGSFPDAKTAAEAYNIAAKIYFGEFAHLNDLGER